MKRFGFKKAIISTCFILAFCFLFSFSILAGEITQGSKFWMDTRVIACHNGSGSQYKYGGYDVRVLTARNAGIPQYDGKTFAYCIAHGKTLSDPYYNATSSNDSAYWYNLSYDAKYGITYTSIYGFPAKTPGELGAPHYHDAYAATQVVMWEFEKGYRNFSDGLIDSSLYYGYISGTPAETAYSNIVSWVNSHRTVPSFGYGTSGQADAGSPLTLRYNSSNGQYEGSFYDYNGVLQHYDVSSSNGVSVSISGNTLSLSSSSLTTNSVQLSFTRKSSPASAQGFFVLGGANSSNMQEMALGIARDPRNFYVNIRGENLPYSLSFYKTDVRTGEYLTGARFHIEEWNGSNYVRIGNTVIYEPSTRLYKVSGLYLTNNNSGYFRIVEDVAPTGYSGAGTYKTIILDPYYQGSNMHVGNYTNDPNPITINFYKTDIRTGERLSGATFHFEEWNNSTKTWGKVINGVYYDSSTKLYSITGVYETASNLGKFRLIEDSPPVGYEGKFNREINVSSITPGTTYHYGNVTNDPKPITFTFYKTDIWTGERLSGAVFHFEEWNNSTKTWGKVINSVICDPNTKLYSITGVYETASNLGKFRLIEDSPPVGYRGSFDREINVSSILPGRTYHYGNITNDPKPITGYFYKIDFEVARPVPGAEFRLLEWSESKRTYVEVVSTLPKTGDKYILPTMYRTKDNRGLYCINEYVIPNEYTAENPNTIINLYNYNLGSEINFTIYNHPKPITATFYKKDAINGTILSGATFHIEEYSNRYGRYIASNATVEYDSSLHKYVISELYYTRTNDGKYRIVEDVAPFGYVVNQKWTDFQISSSVKPSSKITLADIKNARAPAGISVDVIPITSTVYQGSDIFISALINNTSQYDFTPSDPICIDLIISYENEVYPDLKDDVVPKYNQQLVWFKFHVPESTKNVYTMDIEIYAYVANRVDPDSSDNMKTITIKAEKYKERSTPQTTFQLSPPSTFTKDTICPIKSKATSYEWEYWKWNSGKFEKYNYGVTSKISSSQLQPAYTAGYSVYDGSTRTYTTRSGYGFQTKIYADLNLLPPGVHTGATPLNMILSNPKVDMFFPEFNYSTDIRKSKTLSTLLKFEPERTRYISEFKIENGYPYHYTPMWMPDGKYKVGYKVYDIWTPIGAVEISGTKDLMIQGSLYDDFYTVQQGITKITP